MPTAAASTPSQLLRLALPLVRTHGFSRTTLANAVLTLPQPNEHTSPLSDSAVSSLFGTGDNARRTLIHAWLDGGIHEMRALKSGTSLRDALRSRLSYNDPVLEHLPEAFALLASSKTIIPLLDPLPVFKHATRIADEACYISGDQSLHLEWYAKRASVAAIYTAAELHQITSPHTTHDFLDSLLESSTSLKSTLDEVSLFASYVMRSWKGIIKSSGIL